MRPPLALKGTVIAVARDRGHHFSKISETSVDLIEDHGVDGDAHAGPYIRHRYLARRNPRLPNLRQVHLIAEELLFALRGEGFEVDPGDLGENVTTQGLALEQLPLGTQLAIGASAVIELTGLRTPCVLIDRLQAGLKHYLIAGTVQEIPYRAGVLGIVRSSGSVASGDPITVRLPAKVKTPLPAL